MRNTHNTDIDVSFYNDRVKEVMDAATMAEPFTYIPIRAGHMEVVGGGSQADTRGDAIVFGKITEGYDVINPSVQTELTFEDISASRPVVELKIIYFQVGDPVIEEQPYVDAWMDTTYYHVGDIVFSGHHYYQCLIANTGYKPEDNPSMWLESSSTPSVRRIYAFAIVAIPTNIYVGSTYYISVQNDTEHLGPLTASYLALPGDGTEEVKAGLRNSLINDCGVDTADIQWPSPDGLLYLFPRNYPFQNVPTYEAGSAEDVYTKVGFTTLRAYVIVDNTAKFPILKCGATHAFGIVYKDRSNRQCSVIRTSDMSVHIPFFTEEDGGEIDTIPRIKFKIYHKPPSWAKTCEIVYFGNISMDNFIQIRASDINQLVAGNRFTLNIADTIENTQLANARWKVANWVWQGGDRVRLIGTINIATGVVTKYDVLYDYEIEETATDRDSTALNGDFLLFQAVDRPALFDEQDNVIIEIYRPKKGLGEGEPIHAYGTGMVFEIGIDENGNYYHKGDVDQVFNAAGTCITLAEVNNTANDGWKYLRLNYEEGGPTILPFWAESVFPSDWWDDLTLSNRLTSNGFPFLEDLSLRQQVLEERLRHGGFLITGTRTNNLAHFTYEDFLDLPRKNGAITGLREVGYTLKVLQMYKEISIYISRIQTFSADGGESDFSLVNQLFGTVRPMEDDYGCQHPNSVLVNGRNLYYWDNNEGAFIRSSPNGQRVLSGPDYKMQRWFRDMLKWINTSGGSQVLDVNIGANNEHGEIWATWRMNDDIEGVIFSEKDGRFVSRLNQRTESYLHLGNFFAHLYHQRLWIMNIDEGQKWLYWSGIPVYAEVEVASNVESGKNKVFNAIAVFADHLLQSLSKYVRIPAEASGAYELMETNVPIFELREGVYFGEIMKDESSLGNFANVYDKKLNGREMRGRYAYVRLRTEEHDEKVRIDSIAIMSTLSERNV